MANILRTLEPSSVELLGEHIPLYFSLRAAARMEEALGIDYPQIINRMYELAGPDGEKAKALPICDQAKVMAIVILEGEIAEGKPQDQGWQAAVEELCGQLTGLHMSEFTKLANAVTQEIMFKTSRGKKGNA